MPIPTLAQIAASVGLSMADRYLGGRAQKQMEEKQNRAEAMRQLISKLSDKPAIQSPPRESQQSVPSPLQTIMRDPLVRDLLSQKLGGLTGEEEEKPGKQPPRKVPPYTPPM